jgi:hypothetical protein
MLQLFSLLGVVLDAIYSVSNSMGAVYVASFNMLRGLLGCCEATAGVTFAATALVCSVFVCLSLIAVERFGRSPQIL